MVKRKILNLLSLMIISSMMIFFISCDKEEDYQVTINSVDEQDVLINDTLEIAFSYFTPGGFKSSTLTVDNGYIEKEKDGDLNSTEGNIIVKYISDTDGKYNINLSITDNKNNVGDVTCVVNVNSTPIIYVDDNINENTTWEYGNIYVLQKRISVVNGITLTIEPGVIIKGSSGTGANASALLISRGAKLMAEGTEQRPIIFTSVSDNIKPGEIYDNFDPTLNGLWGGLIILGNAPISADSEVVQIEGIPPSDQNGLYGGNVPNDNSGVIKYVSVRHGGANIGEGNEINGLTLGGVGSSTIIENIEIVANQDDGVEFFGGTVNASNILVWNVGDDAIDTDQSWSGTLNNFFVINPGDECFELDGPEGSYEAKHTILNGTVYAQNAQGLVDLDENSYVDMKYIYFREIQEGQDFDQIPIVYTCNFSNFEATLISGVLNDYFTDGSDTFVTVVNDNENTVGSNLSVFTNWTMYYSYN